MLINSPNISGSLTVTGNSVISGSLNVLGSITGAITGSATTASYVEYTNVANKPTLVSGSSQVTYSGLTGIPSGIVSGSSQVSFNGIVDKPTLVSGSSQVTYSGLTGIPSGIISGSAQITGFGIFATTGSNQFNGNQAITGSLTTTGTIVAQTLNVQQVTSSIVYSSGSNIFGNSLANTQQFTGSLQVSGSSHNILGNVGIGPTGTPSAELQVGKTSDVTIAMSNSNSVTSGARGSIAWYNSSVSTVATIRAAAVTDNVGTELQFYTRPAAGSLTQRLTLDSSGNVAAGSTSSGAQINVFASSYGNNGLFNAYGTDNLIKLQMGALGTNEGFIFTGSGNKISFFSGGNLALTLNSNQTATFSSSVTANGLNALGSTLNNGNVIRLYRAGLVEMAYIGWTNENTNNSTWYFKSSNGNPIGFSADGTNQQVTIATSGNVGIGNTSPQGLLQIGANALSNNSDASNAFNLKQTSTTAATGIYLERSGERKGYYMYMGGSLDSLTFQRNNAGTKSDVMSLTRDGNVGIGTDSPTTYSLAGRHLEVNDAGGGYAFIHNNTTTVKSFFATNESALLAALFTFSSHPLTLGTSNTERMRITAGGNVGIGRTPLSKLAVYGGPVQIMQDYPGHQLIVRTAGASGSYNGQLTITIPEMAGAGSSQGFGGYSCEVYVSGFSGIYCHAWFSGYINNGIVTGEVTILRSNGGWSISQTAIGTFTQGFQFVLNYPDALIHPTARIIFNKGGDPNIAEYSANDITAVFS